MRWSRRLLLALAALALPSVVAGAAGPTGVVPGSLAHLYAYADGWRGWPVAPVDRQHPIRGSLDDPRPSGYHIGLDIAVRDDLPEPGAPPSRTHRVYAVEGGTVTVAPNVGAVGCVNRIVRVGHFAYWHADPVGTVSAGQIVAAGDPIGWTCKGMWHVHLSEWVLVGGVRTWVDPLHAGGKLAPFVDTAKPTIGPLRFFAPTPTRWQLDGAVLVAPQAGIELDRTDLRGLVDVRTAISDPQSFRGWLTGARARLYAPHHPYRVHLTVRRLGAAGGPAVDRDVFRADRVLGKGEEVTAIAPSVPLAAHFAPGTRQNLGALRCVEQAPTSCAGRIVLRLFAGPGGRRFWNTRAVRNGRYRLTVTAWDQRGNRAERSVNVTVSN